MSKLRAYLDNNASQPLRASAREAMLEVMDKVGNPSSVHGEGRHKKAVIERARRDVAALVNGPVDGVIFTSSSTEAANLALTPNITSDGVLRPASHLYVLATEHPCVLSGGRFSLDQISIIPVLSNGLADQEALQNMLAVHDRDTGVPYLALQLANSETGIIQPVAEIAQQVRLMGGYVLVDAVQAVGRMAVDMAQLNADFLLLASHKIGGPQGAGALIVAHDVLQLEPLIKGGGQENQKRAGTENAAAIAGFGAASRETLAQLGDFHQITALRDSLEAKLVPICEKAGLGSDRVIVFGQEQDRLGNTLLFAVNGLKAETVLIAFDLDGVAVSSGSACSSGKVGRSHVLTAMNVDKETARGAIRVSFGWQSTDHDIEAFCRAFERITKRLADMLIDETDERLSGAA
ncbi:MAG: cysteine desulfurase [Hyphomicrobiales bacterium]|nr:MAG: cysteine desulfurase [Hyphomicrobiales bacterium]